MSGTGPAAGEPRNPASGEPATFEEMMGELEAITARLAAGDLGIEAAADLYQRAEQLHARASERLDQVRARVEGLAGGPGAGGAGGAGGPEAGAEGQ